MIITIVGHGYVGLISAAVFADLGNEVNVIGRAKEKIDKLNQGIAPFFEPGLEEMLKRNLEAGRLKFTLDFESVIPKSKIVFICVGTPSAKNGEADLSSVFEVAKSIGKSIRDYLLVVTKSTVPVGTNRKVAQIVNKHKQKGAKFDIASCPEFLREGSAISDTLFPDRIVIGTQNKEARDLLLELHKAIQGERVLTNIESAEMIKYASNSLLSTKISFANSMALICDKVGADVEVVLSGVGLDKRLGRAFLYPGVGFGGSCFPKDVKALIAIAGQNGYDFKLLKSVYEVNNEAKKNFFDKIRKRLGSLKNKNIAIWGLAFKPNTDDMREAPSIEIIRNLIKEGANVSAFDPVARENAAKVLPKGVIYSDSPKKAAKGADALVILTEWNEFKQIDLKSIKRSMKGNFLFDGRNIYDPDTVKKAGFIYIGVGR